MRCLLFLVFALVPAAAFGQTGPYHAIVTDQEVKLRAGPSDRFPETTLLKKGDTVIVYDEENGWLAVQDPPQIVRSMSWVRTQVVNFRKDKPIPQVVEVDETGATLRAGEIGNAQPSSIQRAKVPAGTILTVIGPGVTFAEGTWYPVVPPAGDYRYLPKSAVKFERAANNTFAVRDTTPAVSPAGGTAPAASIPAALPAGGKPVNHPLWAQGEAAERDGRHDEAERIYFQLARAMNEPGGDHDVANLCYTRIHSLRERKRGAPGGAASSTRTASADSTGSTTGRTSQPAAEPRDDRTRRTGPGKLLRSSIVIDGRTTFRLEDNRGDAMVYVVPAQGVDLERYVGKRIDVTGVVHSRQGLSKPYIVATSVEAAP
jgi:hypothetical protein